MRKQQQDTDHAYLPMYIKIQTGIDYNKVIDSSLNSHTIMLNFSVSMTFFDKELEHVHIGSLTVRQLLIQEAIT